jgi:WD40 repeat protein
VAADGVRALWGRDRGVEVFDLSTGDDLFGVPAPSAPTAVLGVNVSQDGKKVATACRRGGGKQTGICVVWDLASRQRVMRLDIPPSVHPSPPTVLFSPNGTRLVIASLATNPEGKTILMVAGYDLKTGKKLGEVKDETVAGQILLAAANEKLVVSSSTGRLWSVDYAGGRIEDDIEKVDPRGEPAFHGKMVFSDDGKRFAIGTVGEPFTTYGVRVYDWGKRKALHTFIGHAGPVSTMRFSPDGKYLASGAEDTSVLVWDLSKIPAPR